MHTHSLTDARRHRHVVIHIQARALTRRRKIKFGRNYVVLLLHIHTQCRHHNHRINCLFSFAFAIPYVVNLYSKVIRVVLCNAATETNVGQPRYAYPNIAFYNYENTTDTLVRVYDPSRMYRAFYNDEDTLDTLVCVYAPSLMK